MVAVVNKHLALVSCIFLCFVHLYHDYIKQPLRHSHIFVALGLC